MSEIEAAPSLLSPTFTGVPALCADEKAPKKIVWRDVPDVNPSTIVHRCNNNNTIKLKTFHFSYLNPTLNVVFSFFPLLLLNQHANLLVASSSKESRPENFNCTIRFANCCERLKQNMTRIPRYFTLNCCMLGSPKVGLEEAQEAV